MTADGTILNANSIVQSDLFEALKGGSNNFGIITRFDLQIYPDHGLWGGHITYPASTILQQLSAFSQFMEATKSDPLAEMTCMISYDGASRSTFVDNGLHYTQPVVNTPIFQRFAAIRPQHSNSMRLSTNLDLVVENENRQVKDARYVSRI